MANNVAKKKRSVTARTVVRQRGQLLPDVLSQFPKGVGG